MEVKVINESGYEQARYGFSLSFKDGAIKPKDWMCPMNVCGVGENWECPATAEDCDMCELDKKEAHFDEVLKKNANRDGGHNKFLEHIMVWLDVETTLELWKQLDTYRVGVSKQSESTMHTLDKRDITIKDFDLSEEELNQVVLLEGEVYGNFVHSFLTEYILQINELPSRLKSKLLPQAYKQRREIVLSYKVLRHIINQRKGHKLPEWQFFIKEIYRQVQHPELLPEYPYGDK